MKKSFLSRAWLPKRMKALLIFEGWSSEKSCERAARAIVLLVKASWSKASTSYFDPKS